MEKVTFKSHVSKIYLKRNMMKIKTIVVSDVEWGEWEENHSSKLKVRVNHLVAPISQSVGPKTCQVTETQVHCYHTFTWTIFIFNHFVS